MRYIYLSFVCLVGIFFASCSEKGDNTVKFTLYGTNMQVRFDVSKRVAVKDGSKEECNKCLKWIETSTKETLEDCQRIKQELNLSDWAYLRMLDRFATASLDSTNEAVLLMYSLLTQSGYGALINAVSSGKLLMSYQSDAFVYSKVFYNYNDKNYYLYGDSISMDDTFIRVAKEGKPIDFRYQGEMKLAYKATKPRTIKSRWNPDFIFTFQMNKNLVDYYGDVPYVSYNENFMTRWATLANYPLEQQLKDSLVTPMKKKLEGLSQKDAVQQILWWIHGEIDIEGKNPNQDTFLYNFDENVWGQDCAFCAEETLFYPYCDAEDRAILFSRLVRDVVGLDVALVYYPGHLATAVQFTDAYVRGDYVVLDDNRYVICDPTYIGSNVGEEMPGFIGEKKTLIKLEDNNK